MYRFLYDFARSLRACIDGAHASAYSHAHNARRAHALDYLHGHLDWKRVRVVNSVGPVDRCAVIRNDKAMRCGCVCVSVHVFFLVFFLLLILCGLVACVLCVVC